MTLLRDILKFEILEYLGQSNYCFINESFLKILIKKIKIFSLIKVKIFSIAIEANNLER